MTPQMLDFYFPFFVFFYGFLILFVIENPVLARIGEERLGQAWTNLTRHRSIAWASFFVGGIWAVQNLFFA